MFELRDITKRYGNVVALNGASVRVFPGEIRALLGANGSGKSTIVKIMGGTVKADGGQCLLDGKAVGIHSIFDAKRYGVAVAYQELSLHPQMSVLDNIMLGQELTKRFGLIDKKQQKKYVLTLLERLNLKRDPGELVRDISQSEQSLVEVAKALASRPKFLLLDEVTASLHYNEVESLFRVLREEKQAGTSILIVTHRMDEVFRICDTATIFRNGETVMEGELSSMSLDDVVLHMTGTPITAAVRQSAGAGESPRAQGLPLLQTEHLKLYPHLKDISTTVNKGEIVGIGGLEGQGQGEYIRSIYGVLRPDSGTIQFQGKPLRLKSTSGAARCGFSYVSGDRKKESVFSIRTIQENLYAGKIAQGGVWGWVSAKQAKQFAESAVSEYRIKIGALSDPASSLSGGNQQKLAVARGITTQPALLLLNDPTKGVDIHSRKEIHSILRECAERGMGVILVSSDNQELLDICNRIYVFYEGNVVADLYGEEKTEENLVKAMLGTAVGSEGGEAL